MPPQVGSITILARDEPTAELLSCGEVVSTSDDENPELLWALRGGGGNFGVATRLRFRLYPLERVIGGRLEYGGDGVEPSTPTTTAPRR